MSAKKLICPDCVALLLYKWEIRRLAERWNGEQDPWQVQPYYVAWQPQVEHPNDGQCPNLRHDGMLPNFTNCGSGGGGSSGGSSFPSWPSMSGPSSSRQRPTPQPHPIPKSSPGCTNGKSTSANVANTAEHAQHAHLQQSISQGQEYAGFIYENAAGGLAWTGQFYNMQGNNPVGFPSSPPQYAGWTPVAYFHDHDINYANTGDPSGIDGPEQENPYTDNYFSWSDELYAQGNNITGFVGLENDLGNQWAQWNANGTPGKQNGYTDKGGLQSGC